jgi:hypothetical protein
LLDDGYLESFVDYAASGESANKARARFYTPSEVARLVPAAGFGDLELRDGRDIIAICQR